MAKGHGGARKRKQPSTSGVSSSTIGFLPQLKEPAKSVGKLVYVIGSHWDNCTAAEKNKHFNCAITDFEAIHTWPNQDKTGAMKVLMMGEKDGPQIDGGDHFWIRYPLPFLEYYYAAHPLQVDPLSRSGALH